MKKLATVVFAIILLGSHTANAALVTLDIFDGGTNGPNDLNFNILPARQAGSPVLSSYTWAGGSGTLNAQIIDPDGAGPFTEVMNQVITSPVGGNFSQVHMNTDYGVGAGLGGQEWKISYDEFIGSNAPANWGGWVGLFVGQTPGFGAEFGLLLRPDGAFEIFSGFGQIASGGPGSAAGENALYTTSVTIDETGAQTTVNVKQGATDLGTYNVNFTGATRRIAFRTHYDGGTATALNTFRDNLLIEVIPEPSTAALLCLAGLGVIPRRRR